MGGVNVQSSARDALRWRLFLFPGTVAGERPASCPPRSPGNRGKGNGGACTLTEKIKFFDVFLPRGQRSLQMGPCFGKGVGGGRGMGGGDASEFKAAHSASLATPLPSPRDVVNKEASFLQTARNKTHLLRFVIISCHPLPSPPPPPTPSSRPGSLIILRSGVF